MTKLGFLSTAASVLAAMARLALVSAWGLLLLLLLAAGAVAPIAAQTAAASPPTYHRTLIVGAGPGGLQLAHFMGTAGRDYLVLDKEPEAGSFFKAFPRWRQLISINKPHTGRADLDFVMRHDWNSLLSEPSTSSGLTSPAFTQRPVPCLVRTKKGALAVAANDSATACWAADYSSTDPRFTVDGVAPGLLFRDFSSTYYPHADDLLAYIRFWGSDAAPRGTVLGGGQGGHAPPPLNVAFGVRVVRVERTAQYRADPSATRGPRFRVTTSQGAVYECTYLVWAAGMQALNRAEGVNVHSHALNYWSHSTDLAAYVNKSVLIIGRGNAAFEVAKHVLGVTALVHVVGRDTARIRNAVETHYPGDVRHVHSVLLETYMLKSMDGLAELPQGNWELRLDNTTGKTHLVDSDLACRTDRYGRAIDRCLLGRPYDIVISCPGWHMDASPFAPDTRPAYAANGKHPALTPTYESLNVTGLYFAGTLAHGMDYRKSSGG